MSRYNDLPEAGGVDEYLEDLLGNRRMHRCLRLLDSEDRGSPWLINGHEQSE